MPRGYYKLSTVFTIVTIGCLFIFPLSGFSQGLINNGASIVLTNTSTVNIAGSTGHYTNQNGGVITNSTTGGSINLYGNWINNAANTVFSNDGATVEFKASTAQNIGGTNGTGFYNLTASGTGTKTFNTASTVSRLVTVGDNTTLNANSNITLLATASSHASVGPLLNSASVTNNVIVQSYFTGGSDAYRVFKGISAPINDALVSGNKTYAQLQSKLIITGPGGTTNGFDKGNSVAPNAVTVKTYNEAAPLSSPQFTSLSSITQATTPGKGFFMFYRGNRTSNYNSAGTYGTGSKIVSPYATPESLTMEYTGPINQGTVNVNLSYTDNSDSDIFIGSNLVGNPYPAVIDWHLVRSSSTGGGTNISPNIYVVKQDGSFATYNSVTTLNTNGGTRYIMPGQAFYVKANAASQTLTFTESCKDPYPASGTVMRFLSAPIKGSSFISSADIPAPQPSSINSIKVLKLNLQNSLATEETVLAFISGTNENYKDDEDALYFAGGPLTLCTKSGDNKNLAINVIPEPTESTEVRLNLGTSLAGNHTINFTDLSGLGGTQLFLEDAYLKKLEAINENSTYQFDINKEIAESYGANRFKLIFRPVVALSEFIAKKVYGGSEIKWSGIDDLKNDVFSIERSTDGQDFKVIGSVQKVSDSNNLYSFLDSKPETGVNYYRLKLQEGDHKYSYTNIVSLNYVLDGNEPYFQIYPNPVKDVLNVMFREECKKALLTIYNLNGQVLKSMSVSDSNKAVSDLSELQPGIYVLKVVDGQNTEVGTEKFIKD